MPERQMLLLAGHPVRIGGRALDILVTLVERSGEIVGKRELMARVWPDTLVEEGNLKVNMNALRRALGEGPGAPVYIATVVGRGYRFVAPVTVTEEAVFTPAVDPPRRHNLPTASTRLVGRKEEMAQIARDIGETRLVTIVGPGGIGKTTLALAVAETILDQHADGLWLIDLAPLKDGGLVAGAIATVVGLSTDSGSTEAAVADQLRGRQMLLVLDSCEHLIDGVAVLVDQILLRAPGVRFLATSREPLRVTGERVRRLGGLDAPGKSAGLTAAEALTFPAVQLFVQRATDQLETFRLSDADAAGVAGICRRLDGLALAIEMAATQIDAFGVAGLHDEVEHRLRLLEGRRGGAERHRTLAATIDWSYALLAEDEKRALRCLATFASSFRLDAAGAVAATAGHGADAFVGIVGRLVAKSLLSAEVRDRSVVYRLLDTTRDFAIAKLAEAGELDNARRRHAEFTLRSIEQAEPGPGTVIDWSDRCSQTIDDIREALRWAFGPSGDAGLAIRLTVEAIRYWKQLSLPEECRVAAERALDDRYAKWRDRTDDLILNMTLGATLLHTRGPMAEVKEALGKALAIAEDIGDAELQLECLSGLSEYELWTGDSRSAMAIAEKIQALSGRGPSVADGGADAPAGSALSWMGALGAARRRLEGIVRRPVSALSRDPGARFDLDQRLTALGTLATVQWLQGFPDEAQATAETQLREAEASNDAVSLCCALLHGSQIIAMYRRDYEAAWQHYTRGRAHADRHGLRIWRNMADCSCGRLRLYAGRPFDLAAYGQALEEVRSGGFRMRYPNYLTNYGEALARQGDLASGLAAVDEAIALCEANGQVVGIPEILRIKANMIRFGDPARGAEAADLYRLSIARARADGSLSWELRSTISLVRHCRGRGGDDDAEAMLAATYARFTEGFGSGDLVRARALLDARNQSAGRSD
ncbi:winged helix-turn-helix domain-containing protein [Methylobrevis sp. L22]|uniref:Winged helix-turn-helix domain-containing protein n=2 Tax=Methylobrevis albus TaxID=2793297 RepID=A0A931I257_9HYPH|nr:winged helix-turn-helix domain-containing protein [Methylobrevis albus]